MCWGGLGDSLYIMTAPNEHATINTVDARHLPCPQPVLMLRQALKQINTGELAILLTTDAMASVDVRAFCLRAGHSLLSEQDFGDHTRFAVARG